MSENITQIKQPILTPENWAIVKHVWTLGKEFRQEVIEYQSYLKINREKFLDTVDQTDLVKDIFKSPGVSSRLPVTYEIYYQDTSFLALEESKVEFLIICLRRVRRSKISIMLVKLPDPAFSMNTYAEFSFEVKAPQP